MMFDRIRRYRELASKARDDPRKVVWKLRDWMGAPPAYLHTRWRTDDLNGQGELIDVLRGHDEFLLVVLDACRYDVFDEVAHEYLEFEHLEPVRSEGLNTFQYVSRCWPDTYDETEYVSAAPPINSDPGDEYGKVALGRLYGKYVPSEHLPYIRDVWRESWDEQIGIAPPDSVTDAALESDARRVVAHYFQPHAPFIGRQSLLGHTEGEDARPGEGEPVDVPVWQRAKSGEVSRATLRTVYESNLRRALRAVRRLVEEVDLDPIVVVGDHGEALGEYGIYAHDSRREHPHVRTVPWAVVDDVRSYPDGAESGSSDASVLSRLEDLGYIG